MGAFFQTISLDRPVFKSLEKLSAQTHTPVKMANLWQKKYPPEEDYPDLSKHNNWMSKCMTPEIYAKLRDKVTPSGCPLDRIIQTGVDNPGHPFIMTVGCVAGDEESYEVFADLLDPVIDGRHNGYGKDAKHKTDLNPEEKESAERRRSNYIPTILFLLMSMSECRMEKKSSWGGEGDFRTRGIRVRVYMRMCLCRDAALRICHALFFSLRISFFLSLDAN